MNDHIQDEVDQTSKAICKFYMLAVWVLLSLSILLLAASLLTPAELHGPWLKSIIVAIAAVPILRVAAEFTFMWRDGRRKRALLSAFTLVAIIVSIWLRA